MKKTIFLFLLIPLCYSCGVKKSKGSDIDTGSSETFTDKDADGVPDYLDSEPLTSNISYEVTQKVDISRLELPAAFTNREFLLNTAGLTNEEAIKSLVGTIVKKVKVGSKIVLVSTGNNYKIDSVVIKALQPRDPVLLEKNYNKSVGASINYILGSASFNKDVAYNLLINDVVEARILGTELQKDKILEEYGEKIDIGDYYYIESAVLTKIFSKEFQKMHNKSDFTYTAININGSYYRDGTNIKQDWKVGTLLVPLKLYLNL